MRKRITLLVISAFLLLGHVSVYGEVVKKVSLNPEDWDTEQMASQSDVYSDGDALVLEIMSSADPAWQGIGMNVIDLDLDAYPYVRINVTDDSDAQWNVKLFQPEMADQTSPFSGDQSEYGTREFLIESVTNQSGVSSFELWIWGIGQGTRVVVDQLEFYGEGGGSSIITPEVKPCVVFSQKGKLFFSGASDRLISIYSTTGQLLKQIQADSDNISVDLKAGMYIVQVGTQTVKTIVK